MEQTQLPLVRLDAGSLKQANPGLLQSTLWAVRSVLPRPDQDVQQSHRPETADGDQHGLHQGPIAKAGKGAAFVVLDGLDDELDLFRTAAGL